MNLTGRLASTDLTTLARVKSLVAPSISDSSVDDQLSRLIVSASRSIVDYLGLHATTIERTEVYAVRQWQQVVTLDARPVDASQTFTVKHQSTNEDWGDTTVQDDVFIVLHAPAGYFKFRTPTRFDGYAQVVYTGGFGADTAAIVAAFPDIAEACELQVKYLMERAHSLAGSINTGAGGSANYDSEYGLLNHVREMLDRHRRWGFQ